MTRKGLIGRKTEQPTNQRINTVNTHTHTHTHTYIYIYIYIYKYVFV